MWLKYTLEVKSQGFVSWRIVNPTFSPTIGDVEPVQWTPTRRNSATPSLCDINFEAISCPSIDAVVPRPTVHLIAFLTAILTFMIQYYSLVDARVNFLTVM